jgi:SAM-dependent methyltransferase
MPSGHSRASYTPDQFQLLFHAQDRHFWFKCRNRCIAAAIRSLPEAGQIRNVLEVGCGTGVVLSELERLFPARQVVGMDLFSEGLEFARRRFRGPLVRATLDRPVFSRAFDLVGAFDVIEHVDDDRDILKQLSNQITPGGYLIVTVPAHQWLWSYFDEIAHHRRRYSRAELTSKVSAAGFDVLYCSHFMAALLPLMWVKRTIIGERMVATAGQQAAVQSDVEISNVVNSVLRLLSWPDALLMRKRIPIPVGTSLLIAARKPHAAAGTHPGA